MRVDRLTNCCRQSVGGPLDKQGAVGHQFTTEGEQHDMHIECLAEIRYQARSADPSRLQLKRCLAVRTR